jgi:hypothetical protein
VSAVLDVRKRRVLIALAAYHHGVRAECISGLHDASPNVVGCILRDCAKDGLTKRVGGTHTIWSITPAGREAIGREG